MKIGVLALQGAFREHIYALEALDVARGRRSAARAARRAATGSIIPGGESTAIAKLMETLRLLRADRARGTPTGMAVWGTCAGAILIAKRDRRRRRGPARRSS